MIEINNIKNIEEEPQFPSIVGFLSRPGKIKTIEKPEGDDSGLQDTEIKLGDLKVNIIRKNRRINIEEDENSYQASIFLDNKQCKSYDFEFKSNGNEFIGEEIGLKTIFADENTLNLVLLKYGITLEVKF